MIGIVAVIEFKSYCLPEMQPLRDQKSKEVGWSTLRKLVKPKIVIPNIHTPVFYCIKPKDSLYFWEDGSLCRDKKDPNIRVGFK